MSRIRLFITVHRMLITVMTIVILAVTLSFGLGYLIARQHNPAPIIIEKHSGN